MSALTFDANTSSQYLFDTVTSTYLGGAYSITTDPVGGSLLGTAGGASALPGGYGAAPKLNGESITNERANGRGALTATLDATTAALFTTGVWTLDISFRPTASTGTTYENNTLFCASGAGDIYGVWAAEQDNYLFSIYRATGSNGIYVMWQSGAAGTVTTVKVATAFVNEWNFISVSMQASSTAGKLLMTAHHNGVKMGDWDLLAPPTGATNFPRVGISRQGCTFNNLYRFVGDIDEVRLSSVHRSDADCVTAAATIVATTGITLSTPTVPGAQVYDRTWGFSLNNTFTGATAKECASYTLWSLCSALIGGTFGGFGASAGKWTLVGTSNGVAASLDGTDRLHLSGAFTNADWVRAAAGVAHSWAVLSRSINGVTFYLLVSYESASDLSASFWMAKAAFTGGSATARPTSTDEWQIMLATNVLWSGAASQAYFNAMLSTSGDIIFCTISPSTTSQSSPTRFAFAVLGPVGCHAQDAYPVWTYASRIFDASFIAANTQVATRNAFGLAAFAVTPVGCGNWLVSSNAASDALTGFIPDVPAYICVVTSTAFHQRGRLPDVLLIGRNAGGFNAFQTASTIRDAGSVIRYQTCGGIIVPADAAFLLA